MKNLEKKVLACNKCPLHKTRKHPVFGEGNRKAKILFCGEAPGRQEDEQGRPFVGRAGKVLDELLGSIGIKRKDVYIANILKCRPVGDDMQNRAPSQKEIDVCSPYLEEQIRKMKPRVICTLGNYAASFIFNKFKIGDRLEGISKIHGRVFNLRSPKRTLKIIAFYHPAVALYNPAMKRVMLRDFKKLEEFSKSDII